MNFYVLLSIYVAILIIRHKRYSAKLGLFITFVLFFLSAFRGEKVGHDTESYMAYEYVQESADFSITSFADFKDFDNTVEFISNAINKFVVIFGLDGRWVILAYALIMMSFMYKASKRLKIDTTYVMSFFVILGFYFYSLSACRQLCAVSVILYAITFLREDEKKSHLFFVWILVAIFIHSMSFICAPLYLFKKVPQFTCYKRIGYIVLGVSLVTTMVRVDFLNQLSVLASSEHLSDYLEGYGQPSISISSIAGCWVESICLLYFYLIKKNAETDKKMTVFDYLYLFSIFISAALVQYDGLIARVKYNIIIIQCLYLASFFNQSKYWNNNQIMIEPQIKVKSSGSAFIVLVVFLLLRIIKNYNFEVALESDYYLCFLK